MLPSSGTILWNVFDGVLELAFDWEQSKRDKEAMKDALCPKGEEKSLRWSLASEQGRKVLPLYFSFFSHKWYYQKRCLYVPPG